MDNWSTPENKRFEDALARYGKDTPGCWERVAAAVGGGKTADDARRHYAVLTADVDAIESGNFGYPDGPSGSNNGNKRNNNGGRTNRPQS